MYCTLDAFSWINSLYLLFGSLQNYKVVLNQIMDVEYIVILKQQQNRQKSENISEHFCNKHASNYFVDIDLSFFVKV